MFTMKILETMNLKTVKLWLINLMFFAVNNTSTDQQNLDTFRDILAETEYNRIFFESIKRIFMRSHIIGMTISFYLQQEETKTGGFHQGVETERQKTVDELNLQHRGLFFHRESINTESYCYEKVEEVFFSGVVYVSNGIEKFLVAILSEESFLCDREKAESENIICYLNGTKGKASCLFKNNISSFLEISGDLCTDLTFFSDMNDDFILKKTNNIKFHYKNEYLAYPNLVNFDSYPTPIHSQILTKQEIEKLNEEIGKLNEEIVKLKKKIEDLKKKERFFNHFVHVKPLQVSLTKKFEENERNFSYNYGRDLLTHYQKTISEALALKDYIQRKGETFAQKKSTQTKKIFFKFGLCPSNKTHKDYVLQYIIDYTRIFSCLYKILLKSMERKIFIDFDEVSFIKLQKFKQGLEYSIQLYKDINEIFLRKMKLFFENFSDESTEMKITLQIAFFINFHMSRIDTLLWEINNLIINAFLNKQNNIDLNKNLINLIFSNCNNFITILLDLYENFFDFIDFLEILHYEIFNSGSVCLFSKHEEYRNCLQSHYFLKLGFKNIIDFISNNKRSDPKDKSYTMKIKEKNMLSHVMKQFTLLHINEESKSINNAKSKNPEKNKTRNFDSHVKVNFKMENEKFYENILNKLDKLKSTLNRLDKLLSTHSLSQEIEMFRNQKLKDELDKEKVKDQEFNKAVTIKKSNSKSDEEKDSKEKNDQFKRDETKINEAQFDKNDKRKLLYGLFEIITNNFKEIIKEIDFFQLKFDSNINNLLRKIQENTTYNKEFSFLEFAQGDHKSLLVIIKFVFETLIQIFISEINSGRSNDLFIPPDILDIFRNLNNIILKICEEVFIFINTSQIALSDYQKWIKIWYGIDIQGINMRKHMDFALKNNCRFFHKEDSEELNA